MSETRKVEELHGFLHGSVMIPDELDLTAPVLDEPLLAEGGEIHE